MYRQKAALLGTGNGILLRVAFVLIVFKGAFSSSSDTSYFDNSVTFPNCTGSTYTIGNGYCSPSNNNAVCMFANTSLRYLVDDFGGLRNTSYLHVWQNVSLKYIP